MANPEIHSIMSNPTYSAYPLPSFAAQAPFPTEATNDNPQQAPKYEIEVYNVRYIAMATFLISFANMGLVCYTVNTKNYQYFSRGQSEKIVVILTVILLVSVHFCYTLTILIAPRFLHRGMVWLKALPWIVSGLSISILFFMISSGSTLAWMGFLGCAIFQSVQYIISVLKFDTPLTAFLKPYEKTLVPNLLAKIDLSDPNAGLNSYFGPPIAIPSGIAGQLPAIIRYGSQAKNVVTQQSILTEPMGQPMNQPMGQQQYPIDNPSMGHPPQFQPEPLYSIPPIGQSPMQYHPGTYKTPQPPQQQFPPPQMASPAPAYQPPAYQPPPNFPEKSQFDAKK